MSTMRMTKPAPTAAPAPKSEPESVPRARSSWDRAAGRGHSAASASEPPAQRRWRGAWTDLDRAQATSPHAASIAPVVQRAVAPEAASELVAGVTVSSPADASEREAERVSRAIVRMPPPTLPAPVALALRANHASLQRRAVGELAVPAEDMGARLYRACASGAALPASARAFMEPRFGADFGAVRVHADGESAALAAALGARAFTHGAHVFFGRGAFRPETEEGRELIAHELVHVVQQRAAGPARAAVGISQWSPVRVQRLGLRDVVDRLGESAAHMPGFTMLTLVLGFNPLSGRVVARDATTLLRALAGMVPGGEALFQALSRHGVIERAGAWAREELGALPVNAAVVRRMVAGFVSSLGPRDLFRLGAVVDRARRAFAEPVARVVAFGSRLRVGVLRLLRSSLLRPLVRLAEGTRGYELLRLVLEQDPLTGAAYPRTAERMIGGFLVLINEPEKWNQLREARAVPRTWAWVRQESPALMGLVREVPPTFARAWESLEPADLLDLGGAFVRVRTIFGGFLGRFGSWARRMGLQAVTFMLEVLAPNAMPILRRAANVVQTIVRDPVRFAGHLVRAAKQGFQRFVSHIGTHLRAGLVGWLTGALGSLGIQLPAQWDVRGILSVALQVLGITWQSFRPKLVRHLGERVVSALETTFDLVVTLVREGPAAAWRQIVERLGNVQETVLGGVREWVARTVVGRAVMRIAMMLNPAGAVIQAILTTYESVMFFRERATQILQVVESLFDSLGRIASGDVSGAAAYVEATMARTVPVVISFLARLIGLNDVTERVRETLRRVREPVDRALDRAVDWVVAQARRLGRAFLQAGLPQDPRERLRLGMRAALAAVNRFAGRRVGEAILNPLLHLIQVRYGFRSLRLLPDGRYWAVEGVVNPPAKERGGALHNRGAAVEPPYKIDKRANTSELLAERVGGAEGGSLADVPPGKHGFAYIGNTPTHPRNATPVQIAGRYLDAFSSSGPAAIQDARRRFSLVVGVNGMEDLDNTQREAVRLIADAGCAAEYPWATLGMLWVPRWVKSDTGVATSLDDVRIAFNRSSAEERDAMRALEREYLSTTRRAPMGKIRTRIWRATPPFNTALRQRARDVFLHVSDADTVNFNPVREDGTAHQPLFIRFDALLQSVLRDVRENRGSAQRPSDGGAPIIVSGGYEIEFNPDPGTLLPGQTNDLRVQFQAKLDMAVRQAMAFDPRVIYFPEPSLLVHITNHSIEASFGDRALESSDFLDAIEARERRLHRIFNLRYSMATGAPRRFSPQANLGTIRTTWAQMKTLSKEEIRAMINSSQSHAAQFRWARQVRENYGLHGDSLNPLGRLWARYFPVSELFGGYDPKTLKEGTLNCAFATHERYGIERDPQLQRDLQVYLPMQGRQRSNAGQPPRPESGDPRDGQPAEPRLLYGRAIELAKLSGWALSDALQDMFRQAETAP